MNNGGREESGWGFRCCGCLRYVLSNEEDSEALRTAKETLQWRREKVDMLLAASEGRVLERFAKIQTLVAADYHGFLKGGQPLYIIRAVGRCRLTSG